MFQIVFVCQIILDSFSCCCCCWRWPFTFQHLNNTDEEKIVRGRRRPTKNRYRNCECDFCGPSLTSNCSDAMRTVVFFFFKLLLTKQRDRKRILGYKTLLRSNEAYASRLHAHQDKRRYEKKEKEEEGITEKNSRRCVQQAYTQKSKRIQQTPEKNFKQY